MNHRIDTRPGVSAGWGRPAAARQRSRRRLAVHNLFTGAPPRWTEAAVFVGSKTLCVWHNDLNRMSASLSSLPVHGRLPLAHHPRPRPHVPCSPAGIVQGTGRVRSIDRKKDFQSFDIEFPPERAQGVAIGASVAINGTCLTVVAQQGSLLRFDVIGESLARTNLGLLQEGSLVNFERSARVGDEIGGHNVSGHVHTTARIVAVQQTENNQRLEFEVRGGAG